MAFDFLKKKKRFDLEDIKSDTPDDEEGFKPAFDAGESPFPRERPPFERPAPLQQPSGVSSRDIDLVLSKLELLAKRLEIIERKLENIENIAEESR